MADNKHASEISALMGGLAGLALSIGGVVLHAGGGALGTLDGAVAQHDGEAGIVTAPDTALSEQLFSAWGDPYIMLSGALLVLLYVVFAASFSENILTGPIATASYTISWTVVNVVYAIFGTFDTTVALLTYAFTAVLFGIFIVLSFATESKIG